MARLNDIIPGGFDATAVEPQESRSSDPLPAGVYEVEITGADIKDTKSGNGTGLNVEYTVIGPAAHAKRKVWQFLNLRHTSAQAEQIGQSQLSSLCRALGIPKLDDSDQLFGAILRISLKVRAASGNYAASNDVTGYEAMGTAPPPATRAAAPAARTPAPAVNPRSTVAPWAKQA